MPNPKHRNTLVECTREEAEARVAEAMVRLGLPQAIPAFQAALQPAVRMVCAHANGRSHLFGRTAPLPPGVDWPTWHDYPLPVLAVIDLSELPTGLDLSLPRNGFLSVFYDIVEEPWGFDPKDRDGHRCFFVESSDTVFRERPELPDTRLRRRYLRDSEPIWEPEAIDPEMEDWPPLPIRFERMWTLPVPDASDDASMLANCGIDHLAESDAEAFNDVLATLSGNRSPAHRIGGHSCNVQGDMRAQAQFASHGIYCGDAFDDARQARAQQLVDGFADWRLLLQIDSDDHGPMFGDCGLVFIWIRTQDLAARDFTKTWAIVQCS